jgi:cytochrome c553
MGSRVRSGLLVAALAWVALGSPPAAAQEDEALQGDMRRGQALGYTCLGCHGIPNWKNAYPAYSVPKLMGQHPEYMVLALQGYRAGERAHATMHAQASSMSDQDMADLSVWFAQQPLQPTSQQPRGQLPEGGELCVSCHGLDGVGITPQYPTLSGQHADYLERSLLDYKRGGRKDPVMAGFAGQLTDQQIRQLARYYAAQRPALQTTPRNPRRTASR